MLECVINVSEGCDQAVLAELAQSGGRVLLDVHSDCRHHRSVLTLAGPDEEVCLAARSVARRAVQLVDLTAHRGAHPRLGALDVVPFVRLRGWPVTDAELARPERDSFAQWASTELGLPVFVYGPERPLPEVRRNAFSVSPPDFGPRVADPRTGAVAVGCRPLMVAYNLWLAEPDLAKAKAIAANMRSPAVRALAFALGPDVQVSFNLLKPFEVGPMEVMDAVDEQTKVARAELVGLAPLGVLQRVPKARWQGLGLSEAVTIEARLGTAEKQP